MIITRLVGGSRLRLNSYCEAPSTERILTVFADITRRELHSQGQLVQTFEPELTPLQQQILDLIGIHATTYLGT